MLRSKLLYAFYSFTCPKASLCFAHLFSLSRLTSSKGFRQQMGYFRVWQSGLRLNTVDLWIEGGSMCMCLGIAAGCAGTVMA
jgi:hypothetical protein